jgi:hypothetical protein
LDSASDAPAASHAAAPRLMPNGPSAGSAARQDLGLLAKAVIGAAIVLVVSGVLWHGVTIENVLRILRNLTTRPGASLSFRFILQPAIAAMTGIADGLKDARRNRSPFFTAVLTEPAERISRLNEGLNATARILLLGIAVDVIYQRIEFESFYPIESLLIALLLAFVPYCIIRGLVARAWSKAGSMSPPDEGYEQ